MQTGPLRDTPRSMLFVSGEKAERFPKALRAGADVVCIDLEDAVHPNRKAAARGAALEWLEANSPADSAAIALRINGVHTDDGRQDLSALRASGVRLDWLLVPKVEDPVDLQELRAYTGERFRRLVALIESPRGIEAAFAIAQAAGLGALMLGGADLSAELGARFCWEGLLYARGRLVNAAKAAGLQAWDVPHLDPADSAGLAEETRRVLALGYDCKTAIHPQQIATIHSAFIPTPAELEWAQALLQAMPVGEASGALVFRDRMVDAPILRRARRVVELARFN